MNCIICNKLLSDKPSIHFPYTPTFPFAMYKGVSSIPLFTCYNQDHKVFVWLLDENTLYYRVNMSKSENTSWEFNSFKNDYNEWTFQWSHLDDYVIDVDMTTLYSELSNIPYDQALSHMNKLIKLQVFL